MVLDQNISKFYEPSPDRKLRKLIYLFLQLAGRYKMEWSITYRNRKQKVAILVSKDDHW